MAGGAMLVAIFGGLFALWKYLEERKEKERARANALEEKSRADQAQASAATAARKLEDQILDRIGYKIGCVTSNANISDLDGNCRTNWRWSNIRIIRDDAQIPYIPGRQWLGSGSKFIQYPVLVKQSFERHLDLVFSEKNPTYCEFQIVIEGGLQAGESLSYEYDTQLSNGFFMTKEDVDIHGSKVFKREFYGFTISIPVDKLELYIKFPDGYPVQASPGVCMGEGLTESLIHTDELRRIYSSNGFKKGQNWYALDIDDPIMGFTYFIFWEPPPKGIVDALRKK